MASTVVHTTEPVDPRRRVQARVAVSLLEALRDQDLPTEFLDDENVTVTMPRRLGLSGVVDTQIRRYRQDARRRRRVPEQEIQDLMRLVIRRPDAGQVFLRVGADLHGDPSRSRWLGLLPRRLSEAGARRRVRQRLRTLFGRPVIRTAGSPFRLEAVDDILIRGDPGGDACAIVTGLVRVELARRGEDPERLEHETCRAFGGDVCAWALREEPESDPEAGPDPDPTRPSRGDVRNGE